MKQLQILLSVLFLSNAAFAAEGKHLFILSGQSNMGGLKPEESFIPTVEKEFGKENVIVVKDALGGQPIRRWYKKWKSAKGEAFIQIERTAEGIKLTIPQQVFFASGKTVLTSTGKGVLRNIGQLLNNNDYSGNTVRVEGHTDDEPVKKVRDRYPSNWELSTARACTVVRYLVGSAGVAKSRIYPAGFADTRPLANGKSIDSRQKNRRVEITILNQGA